jgi:hypothetical protein
VYAGLALAIMLASLLVAAWCFVFVARDSFISRGPVVALAVIEAAVLVQTVLAIARIAGGARPAEYATFVGYLITTVIFIPLALVLSYMERTRWGSVIAGGAAVVVAVLVLRLLQVWS